MPPESGKDGEEARAEGLSHGGHHPGIVLHEGFVPDAPVVIPVRIIIVFIATIVMLHATGFDEAVYAQ